MNNLQLYPYQQKAVSTFKAKGRRGSFIYATGTGKTEVAIGIIKEFYQDHPNSKVIFCVPRIVLIEQTADRLAGYGYPSSKYFGQEKDLTGAIIITTYQSFSKMDVTAMTNDWLTRFDHVLFVFDEVHLASEQAASYVRIMEAAAPFSSDKVSMLALTATIDQKDFDKNGLILRSCPVLEKIAMGEAIEQGFLSKVKVIDSSVALTDENKKNYGYLTERIKEIFAITGASDVMGLTARLKSQQWALAKEGLQCIRQKNEILSFDPNKINKVKELLKADTGKSLLFAERVDTLKLIADLIKDTSIFNFIESKTPKKKRATILQEFAEGKIQCLGTVHTLDIGFDQKDVANCIFLSSNKNDNQLIQRIGRGVRLAPGKEYAQIFVVYAIETSEQQVHKMIVKAVNDGKTNVTTEDNAIMKTVKKPKITFEWENDQLKAKGYTYPEKETLKRYNFRWNPTDKIWAALCDASAASVIIKRMQEDRAFEIQQGNGTLVWEVYK